MQPLCQQLHTEFAKLENARLSAQHKLFEFGESADNESELKQSVKQLESAAKVYEEFCRTAQKLPDGRSIWLPDYLALLNLAELNGIDVTKVFERLSSDAIDPSSCRLVVLVLSELPIKTLGEALDPLDELKALYLSHCANLETLGTSLDKLVNLHVLSLNGNPSLNDLGASLDKLVNLQNLYLSHCRSLENLGSFPEVLKNLTLIRVGACPLLSESEKTRLRKAYPNATILGL